MSATPTSPRVAGFLAAEAVSAIGSWATVVAIWGYAAFEYDASPGEVSLFGIAFSVPGVLLGPLETELGTGRTTTALAYSAAIVSLTLAVLASPFVIASAV
ncbi:MAG: hypothetical protein ABL966_16405 [Acidimicrobiales bacterium]